MFTKKLIFISQKESIISNCKLKIFDLEENRLFIRSIPLRIIPSLKGLSQISSLNSLFLCGSNNYNSSCFLININIYSTDIKSKILVNSAYSHYNPILFLLQEDILIVIGGKKQIFCEKYSINLNQWRDMPFLPEERYKGNVLLNEHNSHLYLFGGLTNNKYNESILILNLRSVSGWEKIFVKNGYLLQRYGFINFSFGIDSENKNDNLIYIFGGKINKREKYDFILEYDYENNAINKKNVEYNEMPIFDISTVADINKNKIAFTDNDENIYIIEKKNFRISMISAEDA